LEQLKERDAGLEEEGPVEDAAEEVVAAGEKMNHGVRVFFHILLSKSYDVNAVLFPWQI